MGLAVLLHRARHVACNYAAHGQHMAALGLHLQCTGQHVVTCSLQLCCTGPACICTGFVLSIKLCLTPQVFESARHMQPLCPCMLPLAYVCKILMCKEGASRPFFKQFQYVVHGQETCKIYQVYFLFFGRFGAFAAIHLEWAVPVAYREPLPVHICKTVHE